MDPLYFLDVPVYRLSAEKYDLERIKYFEKRGVAYPTREQSLEKLLDQHYNNKPPDLDDSIFKSLVKSFGGGWRYNEIIGYIRVYFDGSKVKSEYWQHDTKRVRRTRTKKFVRLNRKHSESTNIKNMESSQEIKSAVDDCIENSRLALNSNFRLDLDAYNLSSKHTDWSSVFKESIRKNLNKD